jgi:hypothetical protein
MSFEQLHEIAEIWYTHSTFRFTHPNHIELTLQTDGFGFGFNSRALVQSVEINFPLFYADGQ